MGAAVLGLALVSCPIVVTTEGAPISPGIARTPTVAGIVSDVAVAADGNVFTLKDGSEILIPVTARVSVPSRLRETS